MNGIDATSVPGSVPIPIWLLIVAIAAVCIGIVVLWRAADKRNAAELARSYVREDQYVTDRKLINENATEMAKMIGRLSDHFDVAERDRREGFDRIARMIRGLDCATAPEARE